MSSAPDPTLPRPDWIQNINLCSVTHPFRVEWINIAETNFLELGDLKNPWNEYRSVVVGRDGQEYPAECGRKMIALMHAANQRPVGPHVRPQQQQQQQQHNMNSMSYASRDNNNPTRSYSEFPSKDDENAARVDRPWRKRDAYVEGAPQTATSPLSQSAALQHETQPFPGGIHLIDY